MLLTITADTPSPSLHPASVLVNAASGAWPVFMTAEMPANQPARFPRTARLLRHADFQRVYKQGRRHFSATMTFFYWPRPDAVTADTRKPANASQPQGLRVGFTVGKVLGGAVDRNRMKRRLREAVRLSHCLPGVAADVVINPKKSLLTADFANVLQEVERAFAIIEQKLSGKTATKSGAVTGSTEV